MKRYIYFFFLIVIAASCIIYIDMVQRRQAAREAEAREKLVHGAITSWEQRLDAFCEDAEKAIDDADPDQMSRVLDAFHDVSLDDLKPYDLNDEQLQEAKQSRDKTFEILQDSGGRLLIKMVDLVAAGKHPPAEIEAFLSSCPEELAKALGPRWQQARQRIVRDRIRQAPLAVRIDIQTDWPELKDLLVDILNEKWVKHPPIHLVQGTPMDPEEAAETWMTIDVLAELDFTEFTPLSAKQLEHLMLKTPNGLSIQAVMRGDGSNTISWEDHLPLTIPFQNQPETVTTTDLFARDGRWDDELQDVFLKQIEVSLRALPPFEIVHRQTPEALGLSVNPLLTDTGHANIEAINYLAYHAHDELLNQLEKLESINLSIATREAIVDWLCYHRIVGTEEWIVRQLPELSAACQLAIAESLSSAPWFGHYRIASWLLINGDGSVGNVLAPVLARQIDDPAARACFEALAKQNTTMSDRKFLQQYLMVLPVDSAVLYLDWIRSDDSLLGLLIWRFLQARAPEKLSTYLNENWQNIPGLNLTEILNQLKVAPSELQGACKPTVLALLQTTEKHRQEAHDQALNLVISWSSQPQWWDILANEALAQDDLIQRAELGLELLRNSQRIDSDKLADLSEQLVAFKIDRALTDDEQMAMKELIDGIMASKIGRSSVSDWIATAYDLQQKVPPDLRGMLANETLAMLGNLDGRLIPWTSAPLKDMARQLLATNQEAIAQLEAKYAKYHPGAWLSE